MGDLLDQLYAGLAFLLPGFVALHAGHRIYGLQPRMSDLEKSTWSLFLSLGVLGFYLLATGQHLADLAGNPGLLVTPSSLLSLFLIVVLATGLVILWLFLNPLEILNQSFWKRKKGWSTSLTPWEVFLGPAMDQWVIVETDKHKFYGRLVGFGWLEGEKAVRIAVEDTIEWDEAASRETSRPYFADMLIPYEQVVSVVRVPPTPA